MTGLRVWTTEPDVSGTGQAPTGYRDTADEAGIRPIRFREADPDISKIRNLRFTEADRSGAWKPLRWTKFRRKMRRGSRSDNTLDSGMDTLRSHMTGPAMESWFPNTMIDRGDNGVNTSMPMTGTNDQTRLSQLGWYCTPIPKIPC